MIRNSMLRLAGVFLPLVAAAQVASSQATATALPPAATLMSKYAAAVGGPAFVNAKAIVMKGALSMPAAGLNATFQMTQLAPNRMQMITTIPGMGEVQVGYDGTNAWAADPMQGPRVLAGAELEQMKDEADRRSNIRSPELFTSVQTVADTTMNNERCYLVKLTWKSGRETFDCYSATSGYIVASKTVQKTAMGEIPVVSLLSDYKKFGDITIPTKTTQDLMGQQQIITIATVEFPDAAGLSIAPPASVLPLIKK